MATKILAALIIVGVVGVMGYVSKVVETTTITINNNKQTDIVTILIMCYVLTT